MSGVLKWYSFRELAWVRAWYGCDRPLSSSVRTSSMSSFAMALSRSCDDLSFSALSWRSRFVPDAYRLDFALDAAAGLAGDEAGRASRFSCDGHEQPKGRERDKARRGE